MTPFCPLSPSYIEKDNKIFKMNFYTSIYTSMNEYSGNSFNAILFLFNVYAVLRRQFSKRKKGMHFDERTTKKST